MPHTIEKDFNYSFETKTTTSNLNVPITVPMNISPQEFVGRLVHLHNLPCFVVRGKSMFDLKTFASWVLNISRAL